MSAEEIGQDSDTPVERKQCEQCNHRKLLTEFHRRQNKTDNRMRICAQCYRENLEATRHRGEELARLRELERQEQEREEQEKSAAHQQQQRERAAHWPEKACIGCNQKFPINEHGHLVVPFFDMHSSTCERCGASLIITYEEDGRLSYHCPNRHQAGCGNQYHGYSEKYCPSCDEKRRIERSVPCCVCQQKMGYFLGHYQGYAPWGGGTAIRLFCYKCGEKGFLSLSPSQQAFYIRSRCDLVFPRGQVIYGLVDPESHLVRNVGRTHTPTKRMSAHLRDRREDFADVGNGPYYSKATWMNDLRIKGLRPTMKILREVEVAPMVIEWERRYILHGIQQGWPLTNMEVSSEGLVTRARASQLDFLHCSFESLVHENFVHEKGIEAFVHAYYR